ncbi:adenylate/guanylate cyclase domain-containing protein [uncultured Variovorax sp.]|uniref:adenylate/guanylate cyclase domain-containing protein n=1 Tax=uncultured Variovorax sp. TaxID=114708 RepID=UPI0025F5B27F|nr:adenylate/guanylate cyclase domain-containing protein [uncultured Variovorax sp.]
MVDEDFKGTRLRRFRVDVGTIICAVALVQSLLLVAFGYWAAERLVTKIGTAAHKINHNRVADQVLAFLAKTEAAIRAIADSPSVHVCGEDGEQTAEMLWTLLEQTPEIDSINVATDHGHVLMAVRYPVPAIRQVLRADGFSTETWHYKNSPDLEGGDARQRFATTSIAAYRSDFNPEKRTWYLEAMKAKGPVWTQPFLMSDSQELAVGHARPAARVDDEGHRRGLVVDANVSLGHLARLVGVFGAQNGGASALMSSDHHVVARSDHPDPVRELESPDTGVLGAIHAHMLASSTAGAADDQAFSIEFEGNRYLVQTSHLPHTRWQLVSWEPEEQLLGSLQRSVLWSLLLTGSFLALSLFISLRLSKLVTGPIENLSRAARRIGRLELDDLPLEPSRVLEVQHLNQALDESARSLKAFSKFVPVDIIRQLVAEGHALAPGGSPRRITAMFTDVEGFTSISESMPADLLVRQLTEYFNLAAGIFARHGGVIDKFMGDGIMVLWGAPNELEDAEYRACLAAIELHAEMNALNEKWRAEGLQEFRTRVGIHTGHVIAGVLGSSDRLSYTAIGDAINAASRIEGANKELGTRTLISEATCEGLGGRLATRRIEELAELRGRQTRMALYEVLGPKPS